MVGPEALQKCRDFNDLREPETKRDAQSFQYRPKISVSFSQTDLSLKLALVREAKALFGVSGARSVWLSLGLPLSQATRQNPGPHKGSVIDQITAFLEECTVVDLQCEIRAVEMFGAYEAWQSRSPFPRLSLTMFGRTLSSVHVKRRKSSGIIYQGLRLMPGPFE